MSISVARALATLVVVAGASLLLWNGFRSQEDTTTTVSRPAADATAPTPALAEEPIPVLGQVETLTNIDGWLNTDATSFETARGEVTIVQFWTFGCFNCKNTLPYLRDIYAKYRADGLEIIGVHAPEFDYEADPANVAAALVDLDVTWPVALDTERTNFSSWQRGGGRYWPRTFVVDADGAIRFDRIGEGAYEQLEQTVVRLLAGDAGAN